MIKLNYFLFYFSSIILGFSSLSKATSCGHQHTNFVCSTTKTCFTEARKAFQSDVQKMTSCVKFKPKIYTHNKITEKSILLVHGFTGSPLHMEDLAKYFHTVLKYNVVTVVLSGHGSEMTEMDKVKTQDWYNDIDWGFKIAKHLGKKTFMLGHSLGGGLVLRKALHNPSEVSGLYLFDPLISINPKFDAETLGSCVVKSLYSTAEHYLADKDSLSYANILKRKAPLPGGTMDNYELYPKMEKSQANFIGQEFTLPNPTPLFARLLPKDFKFPWQDVEYVKFPGTYPLGSMAAACSLNPMLNEIGRFFGYKKLSVPTFILYSLKENNIVNAVMSKDLVKILKNKETFPGEKVIDLEFTKEEAVPHGILTSFDPNLDINWVDPSVERIEKTKIKINEFDQLH